MKKRKQILKRTLSVLLTGAMLTGSVPAYGAEEFVAQEEALAGEIPEVQEIPLFGDGEEAPGTEDTEDTGSEEFFSSEESTEFGASPEDFAREGLHYIKGRPLTEEEKAEQLAPFGEQGPLMEVPKIGSNLAPAKRTAYPPKFDARSQNMITGAKNQHPFGICWAFGMASLLETSFLKQGLGVRDLSEEHLAYFFSHRENDPLNNTEGDYNKHLGDYHQGGNDYLASIYLSGWSGMTTESSVPLPTDLSHTADYTEGMTPLPKEKAYETETYLTDASFSDYSVDRMKQMLTESKSVAIMYYTEAGYYNPETGGYCYPEKHGINHVVTVVGWDDTYKKENFPEKSGVQSDGAWIVKNSWGDQWGENGYFYLSYEDKTISGLVTAEAVEKPSYPNNYFYDGSSGIKTILLEPGRGISNIFTAKAKPGFMETIGEVNVITYSENVHYTVQIYTDLQDRADPVSGKKAFEKPIEVYQPLSGVKTIKVPEVNVAYGSKFSVVITNTSSSAVKFCVEGNVQHDKNNVWLLGQADVKEGQGFFDLKSGGWKDLVSSSVTPRLKVHTKTSKIIPAPKLTAVPRAYNKVAVLWEKTEGVSGYYLYRSEPGKSKKRIASLSSDMVSYPDRSVTAGVKYTYTLVPFVMENGKAIRGNTSNAASATTVLERPVFQVKASADKYNTVSWNKISGATEYQIYRKAPGGKLKRIATVKAPTQKYNDRNISYGDSWIYMVRAKRGTALSKYTVSEGIKTAPAPQKVSSVTGSTSGIRIKWRTQSKCDGYRIYRKTKSGSWTLIKTISSRSTSTYLDKKASKGVLYYYAVKAYVNEPYGYAYSKYTASSAVKRK